MEEMSPEASKRKFCSKCKLEKDVKEFGKDKGMKDGFYPTCKECCKKRKKELRPRERIQDRVYRISNWKSYIFSTLKSNAKDYGRECTITSDDLVLPDRCPLCKNRLIITTDKRDPHRPSVDRIDNVKGYVPGNVWIICDKCNRMKNNATKEELLAFASGIFDLFHTSQIQYVREHHAHTHPIPAGENVLFNIWLSNENKQILSVGEELSKFLINLAKVIGMTPLEDTSRYKEIKVPDSDQISISVVVMLLESHICAHSWPEIPYIRLEVSTCRKIDPQNFKEAISYIISYFKPINIHMDKVPW